MNLWQPYLFAATFVAQAAVAAISALVLAGVRLPMPTAAEVAGGRPLSVIARQPRFIAAVVCGVVSYTLMNFIMTAAPLAMRLCGLPQESSNLGIQWHIVAMYAPSFFTGVLITRFGAPSVIATGLSLIALSAAIGLQGVEVSHFWATPILTGVGWNLGFLGASALVLECHRPEERTSVQSFNDFLVFGTMTIGSFSSGTLLISKGWDAVLWVTFLPVAAAIAALLVTSSLRPNRTVGGHMELSTAPRRTLSRRRDGAARYRAGRPLGRLRRFDHEHRTGRIAEHALGYRAEQHLLQETAATVTADDDEVGSFRGGSSYDAHFRPHSFDGERLRCDAARGQNVPDASNGRGGLLPPGVVVVRQRHGYDGHRQPAEKREPVGHGRRALGMG